MNEQPTQQIPKIASTPRFSVVVPAFNSARTIASAIFSALAQTQTDLEVIVVDDGSTDATREIVERITDPRVSLVSQPNSGPSAARNAGIALARGQFVSFLDSDDLWLPEYLELAAEALETTPDAGFVYTDAYAFDSTSGRVRRRTAMGRMHPPIPPPADRDAFLLELLKRNFVYNSTTIHRSVLETVGGFDESRTTAEDYELWLRIVMRGHCAAWIPGQHALYRLHSGQTMRGLTKMNEGILKVYQDLNMDEMPTSAHRELLARRRRETEQNMRLPLRLAAAIVPQRLIRTVKRAGIGESWYGLPPAAIATAFPDLTSV